MNYVIRNHKAFTLVEVLVVVLIIGILATIAVPQYQKAMRKSRMTEGFVNLKAIAQASDSYYLANGVRPLDFTELDISFPGATLGTAEGLKNSRLILPNHWHYILDVDGYILAIWYGGSNYPQLHYWYNPSGIYATKWICRAVTTSTLSKDLCKSLGAVERGTIRDYTVFAFYNM